MSEGNVYPESRKKAAQWSLNNRINALRDISNVFFKSSLYCNQYNIQTISDNLNSENLKIGYRSMEFMLEALEEEILLLRYDFDYAIKEAMRNNNQLQEIIDNMQTRPDEPYEQW